MYASIFFDTEDPIVPELDDVIKWLAEIMTEEGIRGTFLIVGEKARIIDSRRRKDVIEALRKHDIGLHLNMASIHPTPYEYLEDKDWYGGVKEAYSREIGGFDDMERIFGKEIKHSSGHGGQYGPQLMYAHGRMGKAWVHSQISLPGYSIVWFCHTLCFGANPKLTPGAGIGYDQGAHPHPPFPHFSAFDTMADQKEFDQRFDELEKWIKVAHKSGASWIGIFGCHPMAVRYAYPTEFWDIKNLNWGGNPPRDQWKPAVLRPKSTIKIAQINWRKLCRFLKENPFIEEFKGISELASIFSYQKEVITHEELSKIAERIIKENCIVIDKYFSPAETLSALAEAIVNYARFKSFKENIKRRNVLGPMDEPLRNPEMTELSREEMISLANKIDAHVMVTDSLPGNIEIGGRKVGIGSAYRTLAEFFLKLNKGITSPEVEIKPFEPYPTSIAENLEKNILAHKERWTIDKPDLNYESCIMYSKLQTWTVKPAIEYPKQ